MNNQQQPGEFDAVLGGNSSPMEGGAVLGGIDKVKLRLQNPDLSVKIAAMQQALNYGEQGLDLVIQCLKDKAWEVQNEAYLILHSRPETRIQQILAKSNKEGLRLEQIEVVTVDKFGRIIKCQPRIVRYFNEDLGNGINLELAAIPGGTFMMGLPDAFSFMVGEDKIWIDPPQHQVTVPSFFIGKYPVTQAQYQAIVGGYNLSAFKGNNRPVEYVSWNDAVAFCQKLSEKTGKSYRLPSESEWEYACRAGTTTPFHFGETITPELVNYDGNYTYASAPKGKYRRQTTYVVNFLPNAFGLYDMHGNVWEWCEDDWFSNSHLINAPTDGSALIDQDNYYSNSNILKIQRGGCWNSKPADCLSSSRGQFVPHFRSHNNGFRVACSTWT